MNELTSTIKLVASMRTSRLVVGRLWCWLAINKLTITSKIPEIPATPKPGNTNNSTPKNTRPARNSTTSNHPAVPPRNRLQKKIAKQSPAVSPPILIPGALNSRYRAIRPITRINPVTRPLLRIQTAVSTPLGSSTRKSC